MSRRRQTLALAVVVALGVLRLACGPPPSGYEGAGRQYVLPMPIAMMGDGGSDAMDSTMPPPPPPPVDSGGG